MAHTIAPAELDKFLAEFLRFVRRKGRADCERSSSRFLIVIIEGHLKKNDLSISSMLNNLS